MKLRGSPTISAREKSISFSGRDAPQRQKERIRDQDGKEITFGQHLYKLGVEYGVDPALTMAFFKQESGFGKAGAAARNNRRRQHTRRRKLSPVRQFCRRCARLVQTDARRRLLL